MTSKGKKILASVIASLVCAAAITVTLVLTLGGDNGGHVQIEGGTNVRGELVISLVRERLQTVTLGGDGRQYLSTDNKIKDFTNSRDNVFGIDENTLIAPNSYFQATLTVTNSKPYDFNYWLEIVPVGGGGLLADQLQLTVTQDGGVLVERTLQDGLIVKGFPTVPSGQTARFTVKLQYLDVEENDITQNTTLSFDMTVHAILAES